MSDNLQLAVNEFVNRHIAANAESYGTLRQQLALQSIDTKHPMCWNDYGYPESPDFKTFYTAYKRSAMGKAGVETIPDKCWQTWPWVRTDEDKKRPDNNFEKAFAKLANRLGLWPNLKKLDYRQRVGRYAGMLIITVGKWDDPVSDNLNPDEILQLIPLYEDQIEVMQVYQDTSKPNYGLPEFYLYNESALSDQNQDAVRQEIVHESRVITWAEGASGNSIYGIPALEAGLNNLINIDKISGAGGEGFWKNARTTLNLEIDDTADVNALAQMYGCDPKDLAKAVSDKLKAMNSGLDNSFMMKGIKPTPISVNLPSPQYFLEGEERLFATSVKTPLTILQGNQSGNQASSENGSTFDEQCESRRANEIDEIIKKFITWLTDHGALDAQDQYFVCWESLLEPTRGEKLDNAMKMVDANQKAIGTGVTYFTPDEVREAAGYDPLGDDVSN